MDRFRSRRQARHVEIDATNESCFGCGSGRGPMMLDELLEDEGIDGSFNPFGAFGFWESRFVNRLKGPVRFRVGLGNGWPSLKIGS